MSERGVAVVLFNLGGPDGPPDVRPFLRNLFADSAIIGLPAIARLPLAEIIARTREKSAAANYAAMGGGSPLLEQTRAQAEALEEGLRARNIAARVFVAMRYWTPSTDETAREVAEFVPDAVVLAPLYPQFSTTTTASSLAAWRKAYQGPGEVHSVCCWYAEPGALSRPMPEHSGRPGTRPDGRGCGCCFPPTACPEGLPIRAIPMPGRWRRRAGPSRRGWARTGTGRLCYQSRVGPLKWFGPSTPEAITAAAADGLGVLVDPVSFVSEHVETLIELDRDYAALGAAGRGPRTICARRPSVSRRLSSTAWRGWWSGR